MRKVSHVSSRLRVQFDDTKAVAFAGLLLPARLAASFGLEAVIDRLVSGRGRHRRSNSGAKALTVVASLLAGGEFFADVALLAAGATQSVLPYRAVSASRCGEWLRSLEGDDIAGLAQANRELVARGWRHNLGPVTEKGAPLLIDIDSTHIETFGKAKEGAATRNYLGAKGYHPLLCAEASTGQILGAELRGGNTADANNAAGFLDTTLGQLRSVVSADQTVVLRADSGFYTGEIIDACRRHRVGYSITVRQFPPIRKLIGDIPQEEWQPSAHTPTRREDLAAVPFTVKGRRGSNRAPTTCRLVVRRTTTPADSGQSQPRLFDLVDYHAFVTDQPGDPAVLAQRHRRHAAIENVIRDLKTGMALNHMPSSRYHANAAWLQLNTLAHNLARLTGRLITPQPITTKTLRYRYFTSPGRITTTSRIRILHLPNNWPWQHPYTKALNQIDQLAA